MSLHILIHSGAPGPYPLSLREMGMKARADRHDGHGEDRPSG